MKMKSTFNLSLSLVDLAQLTDALVHIFMRVIVWIETLGVSRCEPSSLMRWTLFGPLLPSYAMKMVRSVIAWPKDAGVPL